MSSKEEHHNDKRAIEIYTELLKATGGTNHILLNEKISEQYEGLALFTKSFQKIDKCR